jgi:hypothetical protein
MRCDKFLTKKARRRYGLYLFGEVLRAGFEDESDFWSLAWARGKIRRSHGKITRRQVWHVNARLASGAPDVALLVQLQNWARCWQAHCVTLLRTFERDSHRKRLVGASGRGSYRKGEDQR